ncbi:hypothetical protein [Sporosarcina sp. 6E9]|uniref:hypothetical protein n=1 Tax=Sporosarcina sp. 6E9 TaxID=2819235 RepID=UPI001AD01C29|nr:hypothetical protein [Sporosarcina sp. 6E9]MBO1909668.1 hypothetical protein [Microvirga sp. 3-52]
MEKHEVERTASEFVRSVVDAFSAMAKSIIQAVKEIWNRIRVRITDYVERTIPEPRYVHPIVWDTRRNSQVMTRKPLSIVRRMNM